MYSIREDIYLKTHGKGKSAEDIKGLLICFLVVEHKESSMCNQKKTSVDRVIT